MQGLVADEAHFFYVTQKIWLRKSSLLSLSSLLFAEHAGILFPQDRDIWVSLDQLILTAS